jgi:ribosomal protein S18 acetylase RimI-like enzyme
MRIRDWRFAEPPAVEALYEIERQRWLCDLGWDTSAAWPEIEGARVAGRLPGLLAVDERGSVCGWTYFLIDDRVAQVGSLVGESAEATRALIESVVARAAGHAECVTCFSYCQAPGLEAELVRHGFTITRYRYLSRSTTSLEPARPDRADTWRDGDETLAAELLRAAYGSNGRFFAPHGLPGEWERYVHNLVAFPGCGRFDPSATRVLREDGRLVALVLVTALGPGVGHVAQVAVHPERRGSGVAGLLLDRALAMSAAAGRTRATLLVEDRPGTARTLYARRGFRPTALFIAARRELRSPYSEGRPADTVLARRSLTAPGPEAEPR